MRSNKSMSMTKCAVGAMLFGGTLGATSAANAGLVVWNCNIALASADNNYGVYVNVNAQQYTIDDGSGTQPAGTNMNFGLYGSKLQMFTTNPGQIVGVANFLGQPSYGVARLAAGTIVGSSLASGISWGGSGDIFTNASVPVYQWAQGTSNLFGFSFANASGQLRYAWGEVTLNTGSSKYGTINRIVYDDTGASVTAGVVPAPGALALLGMAGIVGKRRRR